MQGSSGKNAWAIRESIAFDILITLIDGSLVFPGYDTVGVSCREGSRSEGQDTITIDASIYSTRAWSGSSFVHVFWKDSWIPRKVVSMTGNAFFTPMKTPHPYKLQLERITFNIHITSIYRTGLWAYYIWIHSVGTVMFCGRPLEFQWRQTYITCWDD